MKTRFFQNLIAFSGAISLLGCHDTIEVCPSQEFNVSAKNLTDFEEKIACLQTKYHIPGLIAGVYVLSSAFNLVGGDVLNSPYARLFLSSYVLQGANL